MMPPPSSSVPDGGGGFVYSAGMTSAIESLPDGSSFGLQFDYSVWSANSVVTFANVRWDASYRDIPYFASVADAVSFVSSKSGPTLTIGRLTYLAQGMPIRVNIPFSEANRYNYLMVQNPSMPISQKNRPSVFFYFIHEVRYVAPNTTEIIVQLDVWTTYQSTIKIDRAYLERGHAAFHLVDNDRWGRKYATVPEGFDLGTDLVITDITTDTIMDIDNYTVFIVSTINLESDFGDVNKPKFTTATGSNAEGLPNGCSIYFCSDDDFKTVMKTLTKKPWIAQGIISITAVPRDNVNTNKADTVKLGKTGPAILRKPKKGDGAIRNLHNRAVMGKFRDRILAAVPEKYRHLRKFATHPYSEIEITTYVGMPLVIHPERISAEDISVTQWTHLIPPNPRIMITVNSLGQATVSGAKTKGYDGFSEHFDVMTGFTNMPTFTLVNNSYLSYMASNAHSIAYAYDSADWSQQKALTGAQTSFNQSTAAINASAASTDVGVNAASAQTGLANRTAMQHLGVNSVFGIGTGAAQGALAGGVGGAVLGGVSAGVGAAQNYANTGIDTNARSQSTAISNNAALQQNAISNALSAYNRDTNLQYARYSAQGDYANAIAGINAKTQDAKMIAPTTVGQVGGDAFNFAVEGWKLDTRIKMIDEGTIARIGDYWLRYGYALNRFIHVPKDFQCMSNFTYWKLSETYIYSSVCPEQFKQSIRGIFEKGVTVWRDPNNIGTIELNDNRKIGTIRL